MKNNETERGKIPVMHAVVRSLLCILAIETALVPLWLLIAYAKKLGGALYITFWIAYLMLLAAYGVIDHLKRRRVERICEMQMNNFGMNPKGNAE